MADQAESSSSNLDQKPVAADLSAAEPAEAPKPVDDIANEAPVEELDLDREVASAFASMDKSDLAELTANVTAEDHNSDPSGTELVGTVAGISDDDVFLDFGPKSQGILPRREVLEDKSIVVGGRLEVVVERFDPESGVLIVHRKGTAVRPTWENLTPGLLVEGRVTGMIRGGLEVDLRGIRAFMPGSHASLSPMKDISDLLNERIKCEVLEVDQRGKNVLVSRRKVMEREQEASREKLEATLEVGQTHKGVVRNIAEFGAFVDIGGLEGLVHIRELSWGNVEKVTDVVSVGQDVTVQVLKIDKKRGRLSLGLKQATPDPWSTIGDRYAAGTELKVRVVRLADFGAFAELEEGIEALIPISEMSWARIRHSSNAVNIGDMVDVVVIRSAPEKRRIALSMKQAQADPWEGVLESFEEKSLVKGRVTRLADFGAFVELAPGVEGMIHISELSDRRVNTCGDVVRVDQEVEARVLGIDKENRRIALSIKQVAAPQVAEAPAAAEPAKPRKPRKKPLRGGLSSYIDW